VDSSLQRVSLICLLWKRNNPGYQDLSASTSRAHTHGAEFECINHTQQNYPHTHSLSRTHTCIHAHRRDMRDVRAHGATYTNTLLHVYLAKHSELRAAPGVQPRQRGHSASTRAACPKLLARCVVQLQGTTATQGTCGIGRARPPASRKGTQTPRHSSPGATPNERDPLTHGNFRSTC